jgi:outer membrane translocation and assembly module TamA
MRQGWKITVFFLHFIFSGVLLFGQVGNSHDSLKLPFAIAKEKRLSEDDLKEKKEGIYLTGEPDLSSDPEHGFGAGAEAQLFFDGKRTDPFFAYTPYRTQIDLSAFYTTKGEKEFELEWDIPYIFNSEWRLRGTCEYELDPDYLFFGVTEKTLKPLSYYPGNDSSKTPVSNASFNDYTNNQVGSIANYNTYQQQEKSVSVSIEHSWFQGKVRTLLGYEIAGYITTTPLNNNSLLYQQTLQGLITGYGNSQTGELQIGLIYDTRDLEDDPSQGSFAEITNQLALTALGSNFDYNRIFVHYNYYHRLFTRTFQKLVFAGRVGAGYTSGNAPFYEYLDQWTSTGDIDGLGGPQTLRGYTEARFAAPVMALGNFELRYHFWQLDFLEQHLGFYVIPFFDAGGVWNTLNRISNLQNLRFSEGPGAQISWNEDTILRFDYGISPEGGQFYFGIGQIF